MRILIADDEPGIRITLSDDMADAGFDVTQAATGTQAWDLLQKRPYDMLVTDIVMPGMDGLELLTKARGLYPGIFVVMITGNSSDERNRRAVELGCNYYLEKPFNNEQVVLLAREAQSKAELAKRAAAQTSFQSLVGGSTAMRGVFDVIQTIAGSEFDVLITGENGTGKERIAQVIHANSPRSAGPFVPVHCGMYAETLIEDELFGHEAGAYTGATSARQGRFERAQGGSVFLDDIDDMPVPTQVKLLRVLQEKEIERLGGTKTIPVDARVIAAAKADLGGLVSVGKFREDLFFRLNVIPLRLPPLRERGGDIPLLVKHFITRYGAGHEYTLDADCLAALEAYHWPGNVRELENAVKRAIALSGNTRVLRREHVLRPVGPDSPPPKISVSPGDDLRTLSEAVDAAEKAHVTAVLRHVKGAKSAACEILGISRKSLWEKIKKHGIDE
jgi:DNA-binding NtrC family response regulator